MKKINREVFSRIWFISKFGLPEHRNAALARLSLLRDALRSDRRFPSNHPVLSAVETECWNWWHEMDEESSRRLSAA
jgi:hypothetical protein